MMAGTLSLANMRYVCVCVCVVHVVLLLKLLHPNAFEGTNVCVLQNSMSLKSECCFKM